MKTKSEMEKHIPNGIYCYDKNGLCPYWRKRTDKHDQENGFCFYLNTGDWFDDGTFLLWDQCKECEINNSTDGW